MALLTAEDVLNKAFSKTKYREGFDQDEVDDFLDEVANTIAQLTAERDDLAARLAAGGGGAAPVAAAAPEAPPVTAAGGVPGTTGLLAAATEPGGANPTGMLAMAQKLHDEYVQAGEAERDRIIDEANTAADQIRERADVDAKVRMEELASERAGIEARIDDLRRFERDYRARLKAYLENLLGDLDHTATGPSTGAVAGVAAQGIADLPGAEPQTAADVAEAPADFAPEPQPAPAGEQAQETPSYDAEPAAPQSDAVSFEEAIGGFSPEPQAAPEPAPENEASDAGAPSFDAAPAQPAAPPAYDVNESWESQLRAPAANPFAPVTNPVPDAPQSDAGTGAVPAVEQPAEGEDAPFTPPSSRMFSDLYGQQRPESEN